MSAVSNNQGTSHNPLASEVSPAQTQTLDKIPSTRKQGHGIYLAVTLLSLAVCFGLQQSSESWWTTQV